MYKDYSGLFTSESVSEGHPDKIADQIADAILDDILKQDKYARVACEVIVKDSTVIIFGEITTTAYSDISKITKSVIQDIGYTDLQLGFHHNACTVTNIISKQSPDISQCISKKEIERQGAGDQGIMFGYATDETESFMPAAIFYANILLKKLTLLRKGNIIPWLRPDAKSQVTVEYENGELKRIDAVLISTQHAPDVSLAEIKKTIQQVIVSTLPKNLIDKKTKFIINPSKKFIIGGPVADSGITGRKQVVDTYGGYASHGGGSFSGKDPSKVDRSAAYMARYIAKNLVANGFVKRCEIQLAYAIGLADPISITIDSFGTGKYTNDQLIEIIKNNFDLKPGKIIEQLNLLKPIYRKTASYGHFGYDDYPWEKIKKISV